MVSIKMAIDLCLRFVFAPMYHYRIDKFVSNFLCFYFILINKRVLDQFQNEREKERKKNIIKKEIYLLSETAHKQLSIV